MLASRPRALSLLSLSLAAALAGPALPACSNGSSASTGGPAPDAKPARMTMSVVLLDDQPDPFTPMPEPVPKGAGAFQEVIVFSPQEVKLRTFVRLVVQPGETLAQAMTRARPWIDARPLPPGDHFVFSEILEENEITKKREPVAARTYIATSNVLLTHDDVADTSIGVLPDGDQKPQPVATLQLSPEASERFRLFTKENMLRRIAVLINGKVVMSALIQEEITGGKISIGMDPETPYEARRLDLELIATGLKPKSAPAAPLPPGASILPRPPASK